MSQSSTDEEYIRIITRPLLSCMNYRPRFGTGAGLTLSEFQRLYQADPFYSWFGLDSPLMYTAHKAAGGMTSVYRQIGIGCQRLIQHILMDTLGLTAEQSTWSYQIQGTGDRLRTLSLDCRIPIVPVELLYMSLLKQYGFSQVKREVLRKRNSKKELYEFAVSAEWK